MNGSARTETTKVCEFDPAGKNASSFSVAVGAICANSGVEYWPASEDGKMVVYVRAGQGTKEPRFVDHAIELIKESYKNTMA